MTTIETIKALPPGERFTAPEIQERCGTSKSVVHDALQQAQTLGLIRRGGTIGGGGRGRHAHVWERLCSTDTAASETTMTTIETIKALPPGEMLTSRELEECCGVAQPSAHKALHRARARRLIMPSHVIPAPPGEVGRGTTVWRRL